MPTAKRAKVILPAIGRSASAAWDEVSIGRAAWQKASGYTVRVGAEAAIGRFKQVIGDGLHSRTDQRQATEVDVAVHVLDRTLDLERPISVRIA